MNATAFVVAPSDGAGAALGGLARALGFQAVLPYSSPDAADRQAGVTPLIFFLFAAVRDPRGLRATAEDIRFHASRRVRFAPLIYFADTPSLEVIQQCIGMGFDDIITQPFIPARIENRLGRQIGSTLTYFETETYFGPDRRDRMPAANDHHPRRGAGGAHRRLEIVRTLAGGIDVLGDEEQIVV